jgi:hypothetical protein
MHQVCQLNTLLVVIFHFGKGRILWFSLLLGIGGLGLFLVSMGLGIDFV